MALDNTGDVRHVGGRVSEARIDYGPGYRIYFVREGRSLIVLVGGGDKGSQARDIEGPFPYPLGPPSKRGRSPATVTRHIRRVSPSGLLSTG